MAGCSKECDRIIIESKVETRLEIKFCSDLNQPGRCRIYYLPEIWTADIAIYCRRPVELRVIEGVESLQAEL